MNGHRWGAEGPPLKAYSRATNSERFASLHDVAAELLYRLELEFDVERTEGHGLDPELEEGCKLARAFPICGCDACDETADSETERLKSLIDNLTAGRFREAIRIPPDRAASQKSEFWSARERWSRQSPLDQARARQLVAASDRSSYDWRPWPKRS